MDPATQAVRRFPDGRRAVLTHGGDTPYTRAMTSNGPVDAYLHDGALAWVGPGIWGPAACGIGPLDRTARLIGRLRREGALGTVRWVHLPRTAAAAVADHLEVQRISHWEFRWLEGEAPPPHPLADRVIRLDETDSRERAAINAVLDESLPDSAVRPGSAKVHAWYGIRDGDHLVACGADESTVGTTAVVESKGDGSVDPVGLIGGVAVARDHQGKGYGAALTIALTRLLHAAHGAVGLGVMGGNARAGALYARLGFTGLIERSSLAID